MLKARNQIRGHDVLRMILRRVENGRFRPGDRIVPAEIAREIGSSPIPVREALCQLVGRGLVTEQRHKGFFVAPMTSAALRSLYAAHGAVLQMALERWHARPLPKNRVRGRWPAFATISEASRDEGIAGTQRYIAGRLAVVRKFETAYFADAGKDWPVTKMLEHGELAKAMELCRDFHECAQSSSEQIWRLCADR